MSHTLEIIIRRLAMDSGCPCPWFFTPPAETPRPADPIEPKDPPVVLKIVIMPDPDPLEKAAPSQSQADPEKEFAHLA